MKSRYLIISFIAVFLIILIWLTHVLSSILAPFICAIIAAYFLDPLADKLEKYISRGLASFIILSIFVLVLITAAVLVLPILYYQFTNLIHSFPHYLDVATTNFYPRVILFLREIGIDLNPDIKSYLIGQDVSKIINYSNGVLGGIVNSGRALFNIFSLVFITPILIFYMLRDWDKFVDKIDQYLPLSYAATIRKFFKEVDKTLSGYIRGQFNVCLILGFLYAIGLVSTGLNFGFLIGFLMGLASFIPYLGMLIGAIVAVVVGLFQDDFGFSNFVIMAVVFLIGQLVESNFLTPKLVGERIGLHPVWVILGLFSFGILFGFVGLILAVPLTAIVGVMVKFLASEYKKHNL